MLFPRYHQILNFIFYFFPWCSLFNCGNIFGECRWRIQNRTINRQRHIKWKFHKIINVPALHPSHCCIICFNFHRRINLTIRQNIFHRSSIFVIVACIRFYFLFISSGSDCLSGSCNNLYFGEF